MSLAIPFVPLFPSYFIVGVGLCSRIKGFGEEDWRGRNYRLLLTRVAQSTELPPT